MGDAARAACASLSSAAGRPSRGCGGPSCWAGAGGRGAAARDAVAHDGLEAWAARDDVVPTLARRARALLDRHAPLDAVDQALVAVVRERMGAAQDDDDT